MTTWRRALVTSIYPALGAGAASSATLVFFGWRELRDPFGPLNAPSQWLWGKHASFARGFSARHTLVGTLTHVVAGGMWALLFERFRPRDRTLAAAATTALVANVVDFRLTPERFTPGFERRLSRGALACVYTAFAIGLVIGARR